MGRREHPPHKFHRRHRHVHRHVRARPGEGLLHLCGVAVSGGCERAHDMAAIGMMRRGPGRGPALGGSRLDLDNHPALRIRQAGLEQRPDSEVRRGGIASHTADIACARDGVSVDLWQAINEPFQPGGCRVRTFVPTRIVRRVAQSKVGRKIDDPLSQSGKLIDTTGRLTVRQRQKEQVTRLEQFQRRKLEPGGTPQVRVS